MMNKIKINISTYTEKEPIKDFHTLYFDTVKETLLFMKLFYNSLSKERSLVILVGKEFKPIYQTENGFPFDQLEKELNILWSKIYN